MATRIDPDWDVDEEADSIAKVFADALQIAHRRSVYNEGSWEKWMIGICALLAVMGIGGGVAMYGKLTALEVKIEAIQYLVEHRP